MAEVWWRAVVGLPLAYAGGRWMVPEKRVKVAAVRWGEGMVRAVWISPMRVVQRELERV